MVVHISQNYELFEVINAFPILRRSLERLNFDASEVEEGESIQEYFEKKHLKDDEIRIVLRKFNNDVKVFLNRSSEKESNLNSQSN